MTLSGPVITALVFSPVYILIIIVLVNLILFHTSKTFKNRFLPPNSPSSHPLDSFSHKQSPFNSRLFLPPPFCFPRRNRGASSLGDGEGEVGGGGGGGRQMRQTGAGRVLALSRLRGEGSSSVSGGAGPTGAGSTGNNAGGTGVGNRDTDRDRRNRRSRSRRISTTAEQLAGVNSPTTNAATTSSSSRNQNRSSTSNPSATATSSSTSSTRPPGQRRAERIITRGGRRYGRTGSQRSTRTLPEYSEEVGEEDVVLIRKRESLRSRVGGAGEEEGEEDIAEMDGEEGGSEGESESGSESEGEDEGRDESGYEEGDGTIPSPSQSRRPSDIVIVERETHTEQSSLRTPTQPTTTNTRHRSNSSVSETTIPDRGWGEAPSYDDAVPPPSFEYVSQNPSTVTLPGTAGSPSRGGGPTSPSGRQGGFRNFVGRLTGRHSVQFQGESSRLEDEERGLMRHEAGLGNIGESSGMGRPRGDSSASSLMVPMQVNGSQVGVNILQPTSSRRSSFGIGVGYSGQTSAQNRRRSSSATFSRLIDPFRTETNSPSTSTTHLPLEPPSPSILPISAPLPGSVIRTSFSAPKKGFTADQMKFLSSTDSLGKFGVRLDANGEVIPWTPSPGAESGGGRRASEESSREGEVYVPRAMRASFTEAENVGWRELANEERRRGSDASLAIDTSSTSTIQPATGSGRPRVSPLDIPLFAEGRVDIEIVPPTPN